MFLLKFASHLLSALLDPEKAPPKERVAVSQEKRGLFFFVRGSAAGRSQSQVEGVSYLMKHSYLFAISLIAGGALSATAQAPAAAAATAAAVPAAATAPAGPPKVAVIAFQTAVSQTNEFQRNFADLQKKFDPKRQQIKTLSDEIDSLTKQLQAQGDKLSDTERASRAKAIDDKKKQLQRTGEDAQNDFQQEMQQTFAGVASKVDELLNSYAPEHGYTLVLDGGQQEAAVVLYATPNTDITKAIIDAYNVKSGVPAPVAPPPSAPAPATKTPPGK